MEIQHEFRKLNGVDTHILLWGNVFDNPSDVILCITGNPGVPDFYVEFGNYLHMNLNLPVCVIGHAGHEQVADETSNILTGGEHKFDLQGQINHKIDLIKCINQRTRLHLLGHSIGAWMLIEILNNNEDIFERTQSVQLLFPTLQKMAETYNGFVVNKILRNIHIFVLMFIGLLFALPLTLKLFVINLYLKIQSLPSHYSSRILKYINPLVMEKVLFLAYDEMDTVTELNRGGIDKVKHLTNVIYSDNDGWAPISLIDDLREYEPPMERKMVGISHAFVLRSAENVGQMASEFIRKKLSNLS